MLCLISGRGFLYLTDSHLYSIPQVLINNWRDNIFCPVVMVLIDSDVFLITENLSEAALAKTCSLLEEYRMIKEAILNSENLYNRETINVVNGRLKHIKENQEKVLKRKNEVYEMLKLPNDKLIYTYKHNIYAKHELKLFEEEILKRMS